MFIIKHKKIFILVSIVLVALSVSAVAIFGIKVGIDFKGGALSEVVYPSDRPEISVLQEAIKSLDLGEAGIQPIGDDSYIIKTRALTEAERANLFRTVSVGGKYPAEEKSFNSIGPSVGHELTRKAIVALISVALAIILFIAYAFRKVSKPISSWKYGLIATGTLLHDVMIPIGLFTILSHYYGAEIDTLFVVAILTVLGLSVSDTIVVFDRIRENLKKQISSDFAETVGKSLGQVYTRSINTSLTVIMVLLSIVFFGPASTRYFAIMLTAGMFFGTYSSIFLASPLLVWVGEMQDKKSKKK